MECAPELKTLADYVIPRKKAIFDSQESERNALPNLRRWLTTSSRVMNKLAEIVDYSASPPGLRQL